MLNLDKKLTINRELILAPNLCDRFTREDLGVIGKLAFEGYQADKQSRMPWERRNNAAMDLAMQIAKDKNFPWQGASNVIFPLITIAALQFSARSYPAIIQGTDVVRYRTIGADPKGEVAKRADRVAKHMSWQVLEEDESWEEQHDRLLINLAVVGSNFVKSYFNGQLGHNVSELVMARDLVIDYWAKSTAGAARKTHLIPLYHNEIWDMIESKIFLDVRDKAWFNAPATNINQPNRSESDVRKGLAPPSMNDPDAAFMTLEQHRYLDLDGDGYAEPYVVTLEESSKYPLRIVARFDENDVERNSYTKAIRSIRPQEYFTKYSFIPSPDGGIYDLGFGAFLGPINEAVSTAINQLLDSGTFQNSIGGFLGRGAKIRGGVYSMAPWEWKRVDSTGDDLRKNLVPFPDRQPLAVTLQLIELLVQYADRLAGTTDPMVGENPGQNTPAETSRSMAEQGMKVYSMIFKRVWRSMREEFKKLYKLNRTFLLSHQRFGVGNDFIRREDYLGDESQIAPVADPNVTSSTMQIMQAAAVREAALTSPGFDRDEAQRRYLKALKVENVETLYLGEENAKPLPNPKMMVEQAKLQGIQVKVKAEQVKWANQLLMEQPKIQAQIDLLKAQTVKLIASIGAEKAAHQVAAFEALIKGYEAYHGAISDRIKSLTSGAQANDEGNPDQGNVRRLAPAPDHPALPPASGGVAASDQGAVGSGGVPEGAAA